jgi:hypothetical protein
MSAHSPLIFFVALGFMAGCSTQHEQSSSVASDWPESARAAVYSRTATATPGFDSPEGVTRILEQRWSLADIRAFCIQARRHNPEYQNLVVDWPEAWKGRLYSDQRTGFDRIFWYATVRDGRVLEYSLGVYRGDDFWLLEIGGPDAADTPPNVTPDPSGAWFIGHQGSSDNLSH